MIEDDSSFICLHPRSRLTMPGISAMRAESASMRTPVCVADKLLVYFFEYIMASMCFDDDYCLLFLKKIHYVPIRATSTIINFYVCGRRIGNIVPISYLPVGLGATPRVCLPVLYRYMMM